MTGQPYDPAMYRVLADAEGKHFWFTARNAVIERAVRPALASISGTRRPRVLEVGCGNGTVLAMLRRRFADALVIGMDRFVEGLREAQPRAGCPVVQADLHHAPFGRDFDLVGLFDVLEHLPDDLAALRDAGRLLRPGGLLVLTVPAGRRLWSDFDEAAQHCRRYEAAGLGETLRQAGFEVEYLTHFMAALVPVVWAGRRSSGSRARPLSPQAVVERELGLNPLLNRLMSATVAWERPLIARRRRLPVGTSLLAIARPPLSRPAAAP